MRQRKIPQRLCNGCGEMKPKLELIRIVRSPEGEISLDTVGKASGRGAYICKNAECLKKAEKNGRIARTLEVAIPKDIFQKIESELNSVAE